MYNTPLAYFITFTLHGSWLHGDERGSYRRGGKYIVPDQVLCQQKKSLTNQALISLSQEQRFVIEEAINEICRMKRLTIHATNVRTNHVHIVVTANEMIPEKVMTAIKSSRLLRVESGDVKSPDLLK